MSSARGRRRGGRCRAGERTRPRLVGARGVEPEVKSTRRRRRRRRTGPSWSTQRTRNRPTLRSRVGARVVASVRCRSTKRRSTTSRVGAETVMRRRWAATVRTSIAPTTAHRHRAGRSTLPWTSSRCRHRPTVRAVARATRGSAVRLGGLIGLSSPRTARAACLEQRRPLVDALADLFPRWIWLASEVQLGDRALVHRA